MIIAAAQIQPYDNTELNIAKHCHLIQLAMQHDAELIIFPEMSLTGYQTEKAAENCFFENDNRLKPIQDIIEGKGMTIIAGAPIKLNTGELCIGSFIINEKDITIYTKQYLHAGEEKFFSPHFDHDPLLTLGKEEVSVAICADINKVEHAAAAARNGSTLYAAGIFYRPERVSHAHNQLSGFAGQHHMNVLMANYVGRSYNGGGHSACWDKKGELIAELDGECEGLLFAHIDKGICKKIYV